MALKHFTRPIAIAILCILTISTVQSTLRYLEVCWPSRNFVVDLAQQPAKQKQEQGSPTLTRQGTSNGKQTSHSFVPESTWTTSEDDDGSKFAYVFYITTNSYACSALVNIRLLRRWKVKHHIHVIASSTIGKEYMTALGAANVSVHIQEVPTLPAGAAAYYQDCLLKLLVFKMHILSPGLKRVLALDSDQLVLRNLDHLFTGLPGVDLAAPRAYWLSKEVISSTFLMVSLSDRLWGTVKSALHSIQADKYDMDIINDLFGSTAMVLSGEYVTVNSHWEDWNLPNWYHPTSSDLNMTQVNQANSRHRQGSGLGAESGLGRPRFGAEHAMTVELSRLQETAAIIHFFAVGKPWSHSLRDVAASRPDAHPGLRAQFGLWRTTAANTCPGWKSRNV